MLNINRPTKIFLDFMLVSLLCGLMSVNVVHAKVVNQATNITPEKLTEAQSPYSFYYYGYVDLDEGREGYTKRTLELKLDEFAVKYKPGVTQEGRDAFNAQHGVEIVAHEKAADIYIVKPPKNINVQKMLTVYGKPKTISLSVYGNDTLVQYANPVFISPFEEKRMMVTDRFIVQFKPGFSEKEITSFNAQHHVIIVEKNYWGPLRYLLRITPDSDLDVLKMALLYHEHLLVEYATPDFLFPFSFENPSPVGRGPKIIENYWADKYFVEIKTFGRKTRYVANDILAQAKPNVTADQVEGIIAKYRGELRRFETPNQFRGGGFSIIRVPNALDIFIVASMLNQHPLFEYAEQNGMAVGQG